MFATLLLTLKSYIFSTNVVHLGWTEASQLGLDFSSPSRKTGVVDGKTEARRKATERALYTHIGLILGKSWC